MENTRNSSNRFGEETIFGHVPSIYFDSGFFDESDPQNDSKNGTEKTESSTLKRDLNELDKTDDDIFERLRKRIALATKKSDEHDVVNVDDSEDEADQPIWKPGRYLKKHMRELEMNRVAGIRQKLLTQGKVKLVPYSKNSFRLVASDGRNKNASSLLKNLVPATGHIKEAAPVNNNVLKGIKLVPVPQNNSNLVKTNLIQP